MTLRGACVIVALGLIALVCGRASAHDLGVARVELLETAPGVYVLTAEVPDGLSARCGEPGLPGRCAFTEVGGSGAFPGVVRYEFSCMGEPLRAGDELVLDWPREGAMVVARWADGTTASRFIARGSGGIVLPLDQLAAGSGSLADTARRYTALGIEHILGGIDHLLFVLGLMLLVRRVRMLVETITAFTIAHSITLALATLGYVNVSPGPVEASIALSIVFLAVEIVHARRGHPGLAARAPWVVAFGFGLLHGLGFAGALSELGMARGEVAPALLFFNIGVEAGQLMFVGVILAAGWLLRGVHRRLPAMSELVPAYVIGTAATYWLIERSAAMALIWEIGG